jgi:NAD+ diphosphatase
MDERKYCCFCGKKLVLKALSDGSEGKFCAKCDYVFFDAPSPAVIVMVTNGNRVVLTRAAEWKHPYWGLVSGHIMLGETAEQTAVREVYEETRLRIRDLKILKTYVSKYQDDLLMIAFKAETGDSTIEKSKELEDAKWFELNEPLPMRSTSVAGQVVRLVFPRIHYIDFKERENR